MKFQVSSLNTYWVMLRTKFNNKNEQRVITPRVCSFELWFLCTALLLNEIYLPMKFCVNALHSFKVMLRTKKGRADRRTDGLVDYYMPSFGGVKTLKVEEFEKCLNYFSLIWLHTQLWTQWRSPRRILSGQETSLLESCLAAAECLGQSLWGYHGNQFPGFSLTLAKMPSVHWHVSNSPENQTYRT